MVAKHFHAADIKLEELITTEKSYVDQLKIVVEGYYPYMQEGKKEILEKGVKAMPHELAEGRDDIAMGNIRAIYTYQQR